MATTDVAGRRRQGMFEVSTDEQGNTFAQTSGRGNIAQYAVNGGPDSIVASTAASPRSLSWDAQATGAIPPQPFDMRTPRTTL